MAPSPSSRRLPELTGQASDQLAIVFLAARIGQTLTHMLFRETNTTVGIRFGFFAIQVFAVLWMAAIVALAAWSATSP